MIISKDRSAVNDPHTEGLDLNGSNDSKNKGGPQRSSVSAALVLNQ